MVGYDTVESGSSPVEGRAVEDEDREHVIEDRPTRWKRLGIALVAVVALVGGVAGVRSVGRRGAAPAADFAAAAVHEDMEAAAISEETETFAADVCEHCEGGGRCGTYLTKHKCKHEGKGCDWKPNRCGSDDDNGYSYSYGDSSMLI